MIVFACIDDKLGMMFNNRRQSRDTAIIEKINELSCGQPVFSSEYTQKLLNNGNICDDFSNFDGFAFIEAPDDLIENKIDKLYLFRWNKHYPSDKTFNIDLSNFSLISTDDFFGNSHEKITLETYIRKDT